MKAWIKRFWSTATRSRTARPKSTQEESITAAYIRQNRALVDLLKRQQETLDRIVAAKFDRPITPPGEQIDNAMPSTMLNDVLFAESDAEFLEKSERLH